MPIEPAVRLLKPALTAVCVVAVLGGGLAGCAAWPPARQEAPVPPPAPPPPPPPPPPPVIVQVPVIEPVDQAARTMLAYQERIARLQGAELAMELGRLGDGSASPQATMELALALGQTRNPADTVRAIGLLDQVQRDLHAQPWHGLARLLAQRYAEQRRVEEEAQKLAQQLRDTQRDNQRRVEQLNQQLEALKAIERSLNTRPAPAPAAPAAPASRPAS